MISMVICLILSACYVIYLWDIYSYWKRRGIVGPTPWPIVGNYGPVLFRFKQECELVNELYKRYPDEKCVGVFIGTTPALILRDVEMTKLVMAKDFSNFSKRVVSSALDQYEESLFFVNGNETWKNNRKNLTNLSSKNRMTKVTDAVEYTKSKFLDYVDTEIAKSTKQNIFLLQENFFFAVVCNAVLGIKRNCGFDKETKLQRYLRLPAKFVTWEIRYCFELMFPFLVNIFKTVSHSVANLTFGKLLNLTASFIKSRQNQQYQEMTTFSDIILELQEEKNSVKDGVMDAATLAMFLTQMSIAISVVAARVASYIMFVMSQYPDIQNKCYEEINQVLQKYDGKLCSESISEMKYFDMVVQEAMRKYGITLILNRIYSSKYCFPGTSIEVTPGTVMLIPIDSYRNDPSLFPDPDQIIPERFAPENVDNLPLGSNMAFGYGRRNCIGKPIAMLILKICVAAFLHRFKVEPDGLMPEKLRNDSRFRTRIPAKDQRFLHIISRQ